jgi:undecaprenyl pyrophosphate phosphatase UppP
MLASLIAGFVSGETRAAVYRARGAAIAYALAGLALLCGVGFLIAALYIWAAFRYGLVETAIYFGLGFIVLGGVILFVHRLSKGRREVRRAQRHKSDMTAIGVTTALALVPTLLRGGKGGLGALLAPAVAAAAYAIYRENVKSDDDRSHPGK